MAQLPNINQFLDETDPDGTLDRKKVIADLTTTSLVWAAKDAKNELDSESANTLDALLQTKEDANIEQLFSIFEKAGKKDLYLSHVERNIDKVRVDYMKSHLEDMNKEERNKILTKYPDLKELL